MISPVFSSTPRTPSGSSGPRSSLSGMMTVSGSVALRRRRFDGSLGAGPLPAMEHLPDLQALATAGVRFEHPAGLHGIAQRHAVVGAKVAVEVVAVGYVVALALNPEGGTVAGHQACSPAKKATGSRRRNTSSILSACSAVMTCVSTTWPSGSVVTSWSGCEHMGYLP